MHSWISLSSREGQWEILFFFINTHLCLLVTSKKLSWPSREHTEKKCQMYTYICMKKHIMLYALLNFSVFPWRSMRNSFFFINTHLWVLITSKKISWTSREHTEKKKKCIHIYVLKKNILLYTLVNFSVFPSRSTTIFFYIYWDTYLTSDNKRKNMWTFTGRHWKQWPHVYVHM